MSLKGFNMIICIFKILAIIQISLADNNFKHKARINYKLKRKEVLEEISYKSLASCLIYCSLQQDCITASFKSPTENCLLSSYDTIDDAPNGTGIPSGLVFADGWTTMTKIRYTVFHAIGQYNRYSMTFKQAKQQCIDYGTTIATRSEVIKARSLGYDKCVCSWMSDGTNGLVVQSYFPGCGYSATIVNCGKSKANAFCKLK